MTRTVHFVVAALLLGFAGGAAAAQTAQQPQRPAQPHGHQPQRQPGIVIIPQPALPQVPHIREYPQAPDSRQPLMQSQPPLPQMLPRI